MEQLGIILRKRREEMGYTIEEISKMTCITVKSIEQIEDGNITAFKEELTYLPYYLKNYCKVLNIDYQELRNQLDSSILSYTEAIKISKENEKHRINTNIQRNIIKTKEKKITSSTISFVVVILCILLLLIYAIYHFTMQKPSQTQNNTTPVQVKKSQIENKETVKEVKKEEVIKPIITKVNDFTYDIMIQKSSTFKVVLNHASWISFNGSTNLLPEKVYTNEQQPVMTVNQNDKVVIRLGVVAGNLFEIDGEKIDLSTIQNPNIPQTFTINFKGK